MSGQYNYDFLNEEDRKKAMDANMDDIEVIFPNKVAHMRGLKLNYSKEGFNDPKYKELLKKNKKVKDFALKGANLGQTECLFVSFFNDEDAFLKLLEDPEKIAPDERCLIPQFTHPVIYDMETALYLVDKMTEVIYSSQKGKDGYLINQKITEVRIFKSEAHKKYTEAAICFVCGKKDSKYVCTFCFSIRFCSEECREQSTKEGKHTNDECEKIRAKQIL
jgi:hypothetical protein